MDWRFKKKGRSIICLQSCLCLSLSTKLLQITFCSLSLRFCRFSALNIEFLPVNEFKNGRVFFLARRGERSPFDTTVVHCNHLKNVQVRACVVIVVTRSSPFPPPTPPPPPKKKKKKKKLKATRKCSQSKLSFGEKGSGSFLKTWRRIPLR